MIISSNKKYLLTFGLGLILFGGPLIPNYLFLRHSGELMPLEKVVTSQLSENALYGEGLHDNAYRYKLELIQQAKPDIVIFGSSRVMHMQKDAFTTSFVNAGATVRSFAEAKLFLNDLVRVHKPKIIILGIDYFWFNQGYPVPDVFPEHELTGTDITRKKLIEPWLWVASKKISLRRYIDIVLNRNLDNPYTAHRSIGLFALEKGMGFKKDGSFLPSSDYAGVGEGVDRHFQISLKKLSDRGWGFAGGNEFDGTRAEQLKDIMDFCDAQQIPFVCYLTPVSPTIYKRLQADSSVATYLKNVTEHLTRALKDREYYNFLDIEKIGSGDCECEDGHHPAGVTQYRLLNGIYGQNRASVLVPYLNKPMIDSLIKRFQGQALVTTEPEMIRFHEIDFLQIGCVKNHAN